MRIIIETVDHKDQRYDTVGDWQVDPMLPVTDRVDTPATDLLIRVSRMADWRSEALVAVHELVEALLCKQSGVTQEMVDAWDMNWNPALPEPARDGEPGDDLRAPYHRQHQIAEVIERALCEFFKLDWQVHTATVDLVSTGFDDDHPGAGQCAS